MNGMHLNHVLDFGSDRLTTLHAEAAHLGQVREARASSVRKPVLRSVLSWIVDTLATVDTEFLGSSPLLVGRFRRW